MLTDIASLIGLIDLLLPQVRQILYPRSKAVVGLPVFYSNRCTEGFPVKEIFALAVQNPDCGHGTTSSLWSLEGPFHKTLHTGW